MLHERLNPPGKQTAGDHDPVPATEADETNVRTQADDLPVGTAARVRLPEAYDVFKRNIEWHATLPTRPPASYQPFRISRVNYSTVSGVRTPRTISMDRAYAFSLPRRFVAVRA